MAVTVTDAHQSSRQTFCRPIPDVGTTVTVVGTDIAALVPPWEPVAGIAIVLFALAGVVAWADNRPLERRLSTLAWAALAVVWAVMLPYFAFEARSPLQGVGLAIAIPLSLWTGYIRWSGRDGLVVIGNAIAIIGAIYLPIASFEPTRRWLIETVAVHTHWLMGQFGHHPGIAPDHAVGYASKFDFDGHTTYIVMACTGLGSIAVFTGAMLAVEGDWRRKLTGVALIATIIYGLNLVRNAFVALATPFGWFDFEPFLSTTAVLGIDPIRNSYFVSHTLLAQPVSLLVVLGLTVLAIRFVPGVLTLLDEVIYVLTGDDIDLQSEVGPWLLGEHTEGHEPGAD